MKKRKKDKQSGLLQRKEKEAASLNTTADVENETGKKRSQQKKYNTSIIVWAIIGFTFSIILIGVISFYASLQSLETVNVPELRKQHIVDAMIALQERGLVPQVQLRYHSDPSLKDHVLAQQPQSGNIVRIGKSITLFVSKGVVIDSVDNYIGRDISDVRSEIQRKFAVYADSVSIESIRYIFSDERVGMVLSQDPLPQSEITGELYFSFVVSKGKELRRVVVGDYVGMNLFSALDSLALNGIPFQFEIIGEDGNISDNTADGVVVAQTPSTGSVYTPGLRVILSARPPRTQNELFGLLTVELPLFPAPLQIRLVAVGTDGNEEELFIMEYPGGTVVVPYLVTRGTKLRFFQADELILSKTITQ